jgi:hypothetical protein
VKLKLQRSTMPSRRLSAGTRRTERRAYALSPLDSPRRVGSDWRVAE